MFNSLQKKWNVSAKQFWIIFTAFGCTGLTTAYLTKVITGWLGMNEATWWVWRWSVKVGMLLFGYQVLLLVYGALFGQWKFFWKYEKKLLQKLGIIKKTKVESRKSKMEEESAAQNAEVAKLSKESKTMHTEPETRIAIFASGTGTNAAKIIEYFAANESIRVALIVCNKPGAGVLAVAEKNDVPSLLIEKEKFFRGDGYVPELLHHEINFIVLAGFLWKIPQTLIDHFRNHIINIHPALLPKFGGKGMYGDFVHSAVIEAGEKESGISIHYVDEHYDNGDIIFQAKCEVLPTDTPASLAQKIHLLEHKHYPEVIEKVLIEKKQLV